MLNFRNTNIVFGLLFAGCLWLCINYNFTYWGIAILFFLYSLVLFYGCYFINSNFFIQTVCKANTSRKEIALTFDDGPLKNYTPQVLQVLKTHNIEAAFFCIGKHIEANEDLLKQVYNEGHIIGNHSYTHDKWFDLFSSAKISAELTATDNIIKNVTGRKPRFFRPPYGVINPNVKKAIVAGHYTTVGWSMRSYDTMIKDEQTLLKRITRSVKPGDVFLFHDSCQATLNILPIFIQHLRQKGFNIVRLDKLLDIDAYE
ncbi:polysaccharide deacetylase family protein [Parafilimonas terrae]|uniref:Peptidoglycan/xylan/chitin deacetylase, PgdA/CDA1 family n=1 Tax=Parafilimonas terrae TaxID=1465490 RepID=A0A1I5UBV0_9BACT|nr:polysaccharide deacetylase family protein [Parafilimonas terrae]SFP92116.1 Peptidoglycan/xylan/chitin deacetylase, PgdA/CDA1 family [Parafilimonas terrae]